MTTAERTMAREDALARGRELVADIRAILKDAPKRRHLSYREKLVFLLGGAGSGNFGHAGRPGEIGGSAPEGAAAKGKSHADKPSVKGKNISSVDDNADDNVVQSVLGLNSESQVRDLAESMVQYADTEKFRVTIETEGGGPSDEDLQQGYDDYSDEEAANARGEWVDERSARQEEISHLWADVKAERVVAEAERPDPETNPTFPGDKGYKRTDPAELDEISFEDLTHDLDPSSKFSESERETIRERLRESGGPQLVSRAQLRRDWNEGEGQDFQPSQSFDDWADNERGNRGGSGEEVVRIKFTGNEGTVITREFKHDENGDLVVDHGYFKAGHTGGGLAKDVLRASFDEYEKLGVDHVTVHANIDVGGYAWAKFGFKLSGSEGSVRIDSWISRAERDGKITHEERVMLEDVATEHDGEDTLLWHIADTTHNGKKIGAAVLAGSDWYGEISLHDKASMDRLHGYIAETKPEKAVDPSLTPEALAASSERANQAIERRSNQAAAAREAEKQAGRITDVAQAHEKATAEDQRRTERDAAISQRHAAAEATIAAEAAAYERRAMGTATAADHALLKTASTRDPYETKAQRESRARRAENEGATRRLPATTVDRDLAAAMRHADEIQDGFNKLYGVTGRDADEQRAALASQQRATGQRIAKLQVAQEAQRQKRLSDDPPKLPMPPKPTDDNRDGGSREMFYENEDGTRGDRELWRDLLGDDFPDDEPQKPPTPPKKHALTYREKLAFLLGGEGSGNFGHAGRPGEVGGSGTGEGVTQTRQSARAALQKAVGSEIPVGVDDHPVAIKAAHDTAAVLQEMRDKGYEMPGEIEVRTRSGKWPSGEAQSDTLIVRVPDHLPPEMTLDEAYDLAYGKQNIIAVVEDGKAVGQIRKFAGDKFRDLVVHEMGHILRQGTIYAPYITKRSSPEDVAQSKASQEQFAKEMKANHEYEHAARASVSDYAATNPDEFVAEVFTKLYNKQPLPAETVRIYEDLRGAKVR